MIRVLLVDDQPLVRLGFRAVLDGQPDIEVLGEAGDGAEAVARTATSRPDVVLMDVRMPRMDGIEPTRRIIGAGGGTRVLILTTFDLDEYVFAALRAGASGFLTKDALPSDLTTGSPNTCRTAVPVSTRGSASSPQGNTRCWWNWRRAARTGRSPSAFTCRRAR